MYFKTYLFGMSLINGITSFYHGWNRRVSYFFSYFFQDHSTWYLVPGYCFPLSRLHVKHEGSLFLEECWKYHEGNHTLSLDNNGNQWRRVPWLSAKLTVSKNTEYSMDEFLEVFRFQGSPTLSLLFLAWCIHTKQSLFRVLTVLFCHALGLIYWGLN